MNMNVRKENLANNEVSVVPKFAEQFVEYCTKRGFKLFSFGAPRSMRQVLKDGTEQIINLSVQLTKLDKGDSIWGKSILIQGDKLSFTLTYTNSKGEQTVHIYERQLNKKLTKDDINELPNQANGKTHLQYVQENGSHPEVEIYEAHGGSDEAKKFLNGFVSSLNK